MKPIKIAQHIPYDGSTRQTLDAGSVALTLGAFVDLLPAIAALLSVVWMAIRIMETDTARAIIYKITGKRLGRWVDSRKG